MPGINLFKKIWRPGLALILLFVLIKKGPFDFQQLKASITDPIIVAYGIFLIFIHFLTMAYRWRIFVNEFQYLNIKKALQLTLIGQFFSFFIPGGVGGDVVKALELSKDTNLPKKISLGTVTADRVLGLFAMIFFTAIALLLISIDNFNSENKTYLSYSVSFLAVLIFGLVIGEKISISFKQWITKNSFKYSNKLTHFFEVFDQTFKYFKKPLFLTRLILISLIVQLASTIFMYIVVRHLYSNAPAFPLFFALSCFGFIIASIPITPSGIGIGQTAFYFLFEKINPELGKSAVIAISLLQLFYLLFALIGGFLFARNTKNISKVIYEEIKS